MRDLAVEFPLVQGTVRALDGVSLDLHAGRVLGVVGESGCGKSVTARAILGILDRPGHITAGRVVLDPGRDTEQDLTALDPNGSLMRDIRGRRVGLIFQEPMTAFSVHYTVGNQIIEGIRAHGNVSKAAARLRAIDLLREVGIPRPETRIDAYPFQLSGGLRQRVGIAMALACDPDILIADEPTTALDVTTQAQILELLRRLQRDKGIALMLITHDMGVIAQMADDVAVMYLGRVEFASVDHLFNAPQHPYTRALLRSVPDIRAEPRQRLATIGGAVPHPGSRPTGCPFHPRCPEVIEGRCANTAPPPVPTRKVPPVSAWRRARERGGRRHGSRRRRLAEALPDPQRLAAARNRSRAGGRRAVAGLYGHAHRQRPARKRPRPDLHLAALPHPLGRPSRAMVLPLNLRSLKLSLKLKRSTGPSPQPSPRFRARGCTHLVRRIDSRR
ncbi:MAG TPA: ABC transporter ATP-binding protein [Sporichthyaceae bacterium]|nr:ABC transporter ATP-binding protein [Sporichthyaceae bacterium]